MSDFVQSPKPVSRPVVLAAAHSIFYISCICFQRDAGSVDGSGQKTVLDAPVKLGHVAQALGMALLLCLT